MMDLGLGDIQAFPFVDQPNPRGVKDGTDLLQELGAVTKGPKPHELTDMGRLMAAGGAQTLQEAYDAVLSIKGLSSASSAAAKRRAAVSPSSRSPSGPAQNGQRSSGVRGAIQDAFREVRERG